MKDKILMLVIGILIGAIIASGCFLIFGKNKGNPGGERMNRENFDFNMIGGGKFEMPEGMDFNSIGEPPARPGDTSTDI